MRIITWAQMAEFGEAEPLFREALQKRRSTLGDAHPDTLTSMNNLAELLRAQGKFGEAEPLFREALHALPGWLKLLGCEPSKLLFGFENK